LGLPIDPKPKLKESYDCRLVDDLELEVENESCEVGGDSKVEMVGQNNVVICEGKLYLCFIDAEDVSQLWSLKLL